MYKCQFCGKEFEKQQSYASHTGKCPQNPNREKSLKHLEYARSCIKERSHTSKEIYNCRFCGKECVGKNSLIQHEIRCKDNPQRIKSVSNFIKYNEDCRNGIKHHPHKGQTKETCESLKKMSETKQIKKMRGGYIGGFDGKKHSQKTKEKMRVSAMNYLSSNKDVKCPRYNKQSIDFINALNEEKGWDLQHAENGGEFQVCGYYVDGYDKVRNIVFEYDEPRHYKDVKNSILCDKDIERQNIIIQKLKCDFYRFNEFENYLYKI